MKLYTGIINSKKVNLKNIFRSQNHCEIEQFQITIISILKIYDIMFMIGISAVELLYSCCIANYSTSSLNNCLKGIATFINLCLNNSNNTVNYRIVARN